MMLMQVVQMSAAVGVMNSISTGTKLSIMDQFFLGGPLTLRGFNIKGVGPHEDGLLFLWRTVCTLNEKKRSEEMQTLHAGCSKAEQVCVSSKHFFHYEHFILAICAIYYFEHFLKFVVFQLCML